MVWCKTEAVAFESTDIKALMVIGVGNEVVKTIDRAPRPLTLITVG